MDDRRLVPAGGRGRPPSAPHPLLRLPYGRRTRFVALVSLAASLSCAPEPPGADVLVGVSDPPGVPTALAALAAGPDRVDLAWQPPAVGARDVDGYRLYRDGEAVAEPAGTSHSDTGLAPFTLYEYRVSAVGAQGAESPLSEPVSARTRDGTPPGAPSDLVATPVSSTQIDLAWTAATDPESGVTSHVVYRDGARVGEASGTAFSDTGLEPGQTYAYGVSAVNGEGIEGPSAGETQAETPRGQDATPPTTPGALAAQATSPTTVGVTWTAASDPETGVAYYRVYRDGVLQGEVGGTSFADAGLEPSTAYAYEVSAVNGAGLEGARAGPAAATTDPDDTPPGAPGGLSGEAAGPTSVELTWSPATDAESGVASYRVYRDGSLRADGVTVASFTDQGLVSSTTYAYEVSAVNGEDLEGPRAGPVPVTTDPDDTPPPAPSGFTATTVSSSSVQLQWTAATDPESGISGYRVHRDGTQVGEPTSTSFLDTGLSSSTRYAYRVSAVNGDGLEGPLSGIRRAKTTEDGTPPTAPTGLSAVAVGSNTVELTWSASTDPESGVAFYHVQRGNVEIGQAAGTSFTDNTVFPDESYTYRVSAENGEGLESPLSAPEEITMPDDEEDR